MRPAVYDRDANVHVRAGLGVGLPAGCMQSKDQKMSKGYVIAPVTVTDPEQYEDQ